MNIEVGKAYRTRGGKKAVINGRLNSSHYPFVGNISSDIWTWSDRGQWYCGYESHEKDLISEWQEPEPELKIEAGKFYVTRDGSKARVDATDYSGSYPNRGGVFYEFGLDACSWMPCGRAYNDNTGCPYDIIGPWIDPPKPLEFWSNVHRYPDGGEFASGIFCSQEQADRYSKCGNFNRTSKFIEVLPQ